MSNTIETLSTLCDIIEKMAKLIEKQQMLIAQSDIDMDTKEKIAKESATQRERYIRA